VEEGPARRRWSLADETSRMSVLAGRVFYVVLGLGIAFGALAYGKHSVDRGYFVGRSGKHFARGETSYNAHLLLLLVATAGGSGLALAGVGLPSNHPFLNQGYGRR
jgi:hypothetical protein